MRSCPFFLLTSPIRPSVQLPQFHPKLGPFHFPSATIPSQSSLPPGSTCHEPLHRHQGATLPMLCYCCSVTQLCPALCDPMDCSTPGFPVHNLPEFAQTYVQRVNDTIQPSHPLPPASPFPSNLSQHEDIFQSISSLHQVAKVLELQLQHQSFQWKFRVDFL